MGNQKTGTNGKAVAGITPLPDYLKVVAVTSRNRELLQVSVLLRPSGAGGDAPIREEVFLSSAELVSPDGVQKLADDTGNRNFHEKPIEAGQRRPFVLVPRRPLLRSGRRIDTDEDVVRVHFGDSSHDVEIRPGTDDLKGPLTTQVALVQDVS